MQVKSEKDGSGIGGDKEIQSKELTEKEQTLEFARMQAIEDTLNSKKFMDMIEEIAMQLLMPSLPVISIKKLKNAVRRAIIERQNSFLIVENEE